MYDVVLGDLVKQFMREEDHIKREWMWEGVYKQEAKRLIAAAWRETLERMNVVFDPDLVCPEAMVTGKMLSKFCRCKPLGVVFHGIEHWKTTCRRPLVCPWCRMRGLVEIMKKAWCGIDSQVYISWEKFEFTYIHDPEYLKFKLTKDKIRHFRERCPEGHILRLRRVSVEQIDPETHTDENKDRRLYYRAVNAFVSEYPPKKPLPGYSKPEAVTFRTAIKRAMRYSMWNLKAPAAWLRALVPVTGIRTYEFSRRLERGDQFRRYRERMSRP